MNTICRDFDVPEGETSKTYLRKVCEREIPRLYGDTSDELKNVSTTNSMLLGRWALKTISSSYGTMCVTRENTISL